MNPLSDEKIIDSWHKNAAAWSEAVRRDEIESRRLVTNRAIVEAVLSVAPTKALDIGCGEGWLTRELSAHGLDVLGVDVVPDLIEKARAAGNGRFQTNSYAELAAGKLEERFDTAVCNFSLIGDESVSDVFRGAPTVLGTGGHLIVQTLHPLVAVDAGDYRDGWRPGSWVGFGDEFVDPAPWYFRTLASWVQLFDEHDFRISQILEPLHPSTRTPASVLFVSELAK